VGHVGNENENEAKEKEDRHCVEEGPMLKKTSFTLIAVADRVHPTMNLHLFYIQVSELTAASRNNLDLRSFRSNGLILFLIGFLVDNFFSLLKVIFG
jgi:hypothetical protein